MRVDTGVAASEAKILPIRRLVAGTANAYNTVKEAGAQQ